MSWIKALILGIIQGLTEFLPVSSSGHLEIGFVLLTVQSSDNLLFIVVTHFATVLATIVVFRSDILNLLKEILKFEWNDSTRFAMKILLSMLPVFIVAIFLKDQIEDLFTGNLMLVGSMLLITSGLLLIAHYKREGDKKINFFNAFLIGLAQAFAVIPGISRSGSTIATALILGVERSKATRFSFLMVLIPILGASMLELLDYAEDTATNRIEISSLLIGFLAAFGSGFFACKWMIKIVRKGKLVYFAIYSFMVGLMAMVVA